MVDVRQGRAWSGFIHLLRRRKWALWLSISLIFLILGYIKLEAQQNDIEAVASRQAQDRVHTVKVICEQSLHSAQATNAVITYLSALILLSTTQSHVYDDLIAQYGGPSYEQRLAVAKRQVGRLRGLKVPEPDCGALSANVRKAAEEAKP